MNTIHPIIPIEYFPQRSLTQSDYDYALVVEHWLGKQREFSRSVARAVEDINNLNLEEMSVKLDNIASHFSDALFVKAGFVQNSGIVTYINNRAIINTASITINQADSKGIHFSSKDFATGKQCIKIILYTRDLKMTSEITWYQDGNKRKDLNVFSYSDEKIGDSLNVFIKDFLDENDRENSIDIIIHSYMFSQAPQVCLELDVHHKEDSDVLDLEHTPFSLKTFKGSIDSSYEDIYKPRFGLPEAFFRFKYATIYQNPSKTSTSTPVAIHSKILTGDNKSFTIDFLNILKALNSFNASAWYKITLDVAFSVKSELIVLPICFIVKFSKKYGLAYPQLMNGESLPTATDIFEKYFLKLKEKYVDGKTNQQMAPYRPFIQMSNPTPFNFNDNYLYTKRSNKSIIPFVTGFTDVFDITATARIEKLEGSANGEIDDFLKD